MTWRYKFKVYKSAHPLSDIFEFMLLLLLLYIYIYYYIYIYITILYFEFILLIYIYIYIHLIYGMEMQVCIGRRITTRARRSISLSLSLSLYIYIHTYIYTYICLYLSIYLSLYICSRHVTCRKPFEETQQYSALTTRWIPFGDHPLRLERYRED